MALMPEDLMNQRFTPVRFSEGYDMDEVDNFLDNEVEPRIPDTIINAFKKAGAAGFGDDEIAAVFEVLRRNSQ